MTIRPYTHTKAGTGDAATGGTRSHAATSESPVTAATDSTGHVANPVFSAPHVSAMAHRAAGPDNVGPDRPLFPLSFLFVTLSRYCIVAIAVRFVCFGLNIFVSVLFYSVLFCYLLFCSVLFCSVLFYLLYFLITHA